MKRFNDFLNEASGGFAHRDLFHQTMMDVTENLPFVVNTERGTHKFRNLHVATLNHGSMANYVRHMERRPRHAEAAGRLGADHSHFTRIITPHVVRATKLAISKMPSSSASYMISKYTPEQMAERFLRTQRQTARFHLKGHLGALPMSKHVRAVSGYLVDNSTKDPVHNYSRGGHFGMVDDDTSQEHTAEFFTHMR